MRDRRDWWCAMMVADMGAPGPEPVDLIACIRAAVVLTALCALPIAVGEIWGAEVLRISLIAGVVLYSVIGIAVILWPERK
jgi:hypothetical protein